MNQSDRFLIPPIEAETYDPTVQATQVAHRAFSGSVPSSTGAISLKAWCIVFQQHPHSRARYRKIEKMLGTVDANGYAPLKLANVAGVAFSSMSERTDVMGEFTTIWVSRVDSGSDERGAVLACLNGTITHLITIDPNDATGDDRAIYLVEEIAKRIAARAPEMLLANQVKEEDAVVRLPTLDDLAGLIDDATIEIDTYEAR